MKRHNIPIIRSNPVNIKLRIILTITLCLISTAPGRSPDTNIDQYKNTLIDAVYNNKPLSKVLSSYSNAVTSLTETQKRSYTRINLDCLLARSLFDNGKKKKAESLLRKTLERLESEIAILVSDHTWSLRATTLSQLCKVKGKVYAVSHKPQALIWARKAVEINPNNAYARLIIINSIISPPPIFGGTPKKGKSKLKKLLKKNPNAGMDLRFHIYVDIGKASLNAKQTDAPIWFEKALEIFPGNIYAKRQLKEARIKIKMFK